MKTALCISGELRRIDLFFPIIKKNILEPYDPDVFISTWNMPERIPTSVASTVRNPNELICFDKTIELYQPTGIYKQTYNLNIKQNLKTIGNTVTDNLMCMVFHIQKSIQLAQDRESLLGTYYDLIIRYRFDYGVKIRFEDYNLNYINIPNEHDYGGYQDQFAFGKSSIMNVYAMWIQHITHIENRFAKKTNMSTRLPDHAGFPWQPESALKRYLDSTHAQINLIDGLEIVYPWTDKKEIEELYD